ncbi:MAG: hypothetical protein J0I47_02625 [Sphingomonas sp.]|uniref:hypothetical protein n=1 Tax=Sphingomonas sp. TaxID=28214 RepID=UPI001AC9772B|nr:hypothetical protein [Sphingomonas sp.]MBN8807122.1 hypothetical protein [Sphingomonas sp.]
MKLVLLAAAAAIAMPAFAQDTPPPAPAQTMPTTPPPADPATATPAPMPPATTTAPMPMAPAATPPATMTMAPPSPVVQPLPDAAAMPADGKVPMCSRTVTDHCMERSNGRGERMHSTPRAR